MDQPFICEGNCATLLVTLLLLIVLQPNITNCAGITADIWKPVKPNLPIIGNYYQVLESLSRIRCCGMCREMYSWDRVYFDGQNCYCLAPVHANASDVMGSIILQTNVHHQQKFYSRSVCDSKGYTRYTNTNYCLKYYNIKLKWYDAEQQCQNDGGHIVSANSQAKIDDIVTMQPKYTYIWIGGHKTIETGHKFGWISGEQVADSLWKPLEPNNQGGEFCIEMFAGTINDKRCTAKKTFVCEIYIL